MKIRFALILFLLSQAAGEDGDGQDSDGGELGKGGVPRQGTIIAVPNNVVQQPNAFQQPNLFPQPALFPQPNPFPQQQQPVIFSSPPIQAPAERSFLQVYLDFLLLKQLLRFLRPHPTEDWYTSTINNCRYEFFGASHYFDARLKCESFKARIASAGMRNFQVVTELATEYGGLGHPWWAGLDNLENVDVWRWNDGQVQAIGPGTGWANNEPENMERCARLQEPDASVTLSGAPCDDSVNFFCEYCPDE